MVQEASLGGADATYDAANTLSRLSTFFYESITRGSHSLYVLSSARSRVHYRTRDVIKMLN